MRTFIAIEFPATIHQQLEATCADVRSYLRTRHAPDCLRWANNNIHLTLRFLGETTIAQAEALATGLHELVGERQAFDLSIGNIGGFPNLRQPRVLWLGVGGDLPQLNAFQAAVERAVQLAGFAAADRPFSAHLTLARARRNATKEQLRVVGQLLDGYGTVDQAQFRVNEMVHMQSELRPAGAIYRPLGRFRFDADE